MAQIKIALAGNPNCGKTTLFNALTGANQYVGNWPGVTVEKKDGRLKDNRDVTVQDLPGIYSLSPYTLEEVVARNYLVNEKPDAILNIVDGTNIERNLYLTTQLIELGIPVVIAVNMADLVRKNGDRIDLEQLGAAMGCKAVAMSALKGDGTAAAANAAVAAAKAGRAAKLPQVFTGCVEEAIEQIGWTPALSAGTLSSCSSGTRRSPPSSSWMRLPPQASNRPSPPVKRSWTTMPRASSRVSATPSSTASCRKPTPARRAKTT